MAKLTQKKVFDAGTLNPARLSREINDGTVGQSYENAPKSPYAISETNVLPFTNDRIVGKYIHTTIADAGSVRPGTAG